MKRVVLPMLLMWLPLWVAAQQEVDSLETLTSMAEDSVMMDSLRTSSLIAHSDSVVAKAAKLPVPRFIPDPNRALWLALVFPGAGQIYNRKYWKLPIIYGGFLGCMYALNWNQQMLRDYSQAYLDIMDSDPNTKSYEKMLPIGYDITGKESQFKDIFKNKKNYYRKYRDMSILAFAGVYLIAVIDAYVDAQLSTFDITPDLSMQLTPAVINNEHLSPQGRHSASADIDPYADRGVGMSLKFNF